MLLSALAGCLLGFYSSLQMISTDPIPAKRRCGLAFALVFAFGAIGVWRAL